MSTEGVEIDLGQDVRPELITSFIDRILRKQAEKDEVAADIREIYAEAKSMGFDKTAMGEVVSGIREAEKDPQKHEERSHIVATYALAYEKGKRLQGQTSTHTHARARVREEKPPTELQRRYGMGA